MRRNLELDSNKRSQSSLKPVNFKFTGGVVQGDPEKPNELNITGSYLLVQITWESSTGNMKDLAEVQFQEKLEYPAEGTDKNGSYTAPEPFNFAIKNPSYVKFEGMNEKGFVDRHVGYSVLNPFKSAQNDSHPDLSI